MTDANAPSPYRLWVEVAGRKMAVDFIERVDSFCPIDNAVTAQNRYVSIISGTGPGLGAPYFVRPFLSRYSTRGKRGTKSQWDICLTCRQLWPSDQTAVNETAFHYPGMMLAWRNQEGFGTRLEMLGLRSRQDPTVTATNCRHCGGRTLVAAPRCGGCGSEDFAP